METVLVIYRSTGEDFRFDRNYYEAHHLPLVRKTWEPFGLESTVALYPTGVTDIVAVAMNEFRDEEAATAAFSAPESEPVMNDIARYTDLTPIRLRGIPLTY